MSFTRFYSGLNDRKVVRVQVNSHKAFREIGKETDRCIDHRDALVRVSENFGQAAESNGLYAFYIVRLTSIDIFPFYM
jgi:hypothetical protein